MTENEIHFRNTDDCIKKIKSIRTMYRDTTPSYVALSDAIQALEEIQQYREIGTLEEIKKVISFLSNDNDNSVIDDMNVLNAYRSIGTIDEFKALKEKDNKDFELLLKAVKESYPMFKGAYVELDVFMGDVMRRFTRDRKQS